MRGSTAKNSVLPRCGERSSWGSSSTGTYTRAGASAISSSLSCSALWRETVKSGLSAPFLTVSGRTKSNTRRFGHSGALRFHLRNRFAAQGIERTCADSETTVECDGALRRRKCRAAGFPEARFDLFRGDGAAARRLGNCAGGGHAWPPKSSAVRAIG